MNVILFFLSALFLVAIWGFGYSIIHELIHLLAARKVGVQIVALMIHPLIFGVLPGRSISKTPWSKRAFVLLSPLPFSMALALTFTYLLGFPIVWILMFGIFHAGDFAMLFKKKFEYTPISKIKKMGFWKRGILIELKNELRK